MILYMIIVLLLVVLWIHFYQKNIEKKQLEFIVNYDFSPQLLKRVKQQHDYLKDSDMRQVVRAMKDYFYICNQAKGKMVAMPSEIVDVLWHEFILFTREYEQFCQKALGTFLHHTPTEAMKSKTSAQEGIKRAWRLACAKANINPKHPKKLPLLFHIDTTLNIVGGFTYALDCKKTPFDVHNNHSSCGGYCATDIGCASGCVGDSGISSEVGSFFGDGDASASCGGGCGGGN